MTHIRGRAEIIASSDSDHRDTAENIVSSADELVSLSERAREVEDVLSQTADPTTEVALADLAEAVIEPYREEFPDATLSVDVEDSLRLTVDRLVLSSVLDNLVENALVHNDAPTPVVTVSARETGDGSVRLSVSDNGPGIPESERAVIESGTESALDHGSGLGLWAVKWGVIRLGGELSLRDGTPEGAVVSVILPNVTRRETAAPPQAEAD